MPKELVMIPSFSFVRNDKENKCIGKGFENKMHSNQIKIW